VGSTGPAGSAGPTGPTGPPGPAGKIELVTCKKVRGKQKCTTKVVSGTISFTTASDALKATLSRHGRLTATGTVRSVDGHTEFVSNDSGVLSSGRYMLTITRKTGGHITTTHQTITIT
jgi:hypothetical protein